ncbi:ly-6/neurotoxin-like protein 1 [Portunus trituberculatus]|uniref:ly-6/neurotoxin-like protein 1 n=1 Tax=Portunus trituberculatus TaxID=210409 RepID=UPI001E1D074D|nr:ly-6/neurotoxin-like protein 1 [Portunus trituberculatus]XP_045117042.1 ly-6/neurotoxin-like protein 1 [Portunus trituberculatus]
MACAGVCTTATVLLITVLVALLVIPGSRGLRCYQCGALREGMSTVNPCFGIKVEDNRECSAEQKFCKRYSNEGVLVLACEENCVESHSQTTDITCCDTDGCNGGGITAPSALLLALPALVTVTGLLLTPMPR